MRKTALENDETRVLERYRAKQLKIVTYSNRLKYFPSLSVAIFGRIK